jgi:hypothetical protein
MTPRRILPRTWPAPLGAVAYHGVIGEYTRAVSPHTEADPAAVLIQTIVCRGNAMGRQPHFFVEDTRHGNKPVRSRRWRHVPRAQGNSARQGTRVGRGSR